ncbi:hypothetical protein [Pseudomonas lundensis]|nr:hypothetical protein [Pseudomonas lundensis]NMZ54181.1 hypothetical protein [Pseudomonas lundensis]
MRKEFLTSDFTRSDVRGLAERNFEEIGNAVRDGANGYQLEIDQKDAISNMISSWDIESQNRFLSMHAEEVNACIQKTMDSVAEINRNTAETIRKTAEINQQALQNEFTSSQVYSWIIGLVFLSIMMIVIFK